MPQVVVAAVATAVFAALGGASIAAIIGLTALTVGAALLSQALAPEAAKIKTRGLTQTFRAPAAPRQLIYGERRIGGTIVFAHVTRSHLSDEFPGVEFFSNHFLHLVVALAAGEVEAIGDLYLDDERVPLEPDPDASTDLLVPVAGNRYAWSPNRSGVLGVAKHLGTADQAVDAAMARIQAELTGPEPDWPEFPGELWGADHRLRGAAYIYLRFGFNRDKFPAGLPNVSAMVRGRKVLDPRTAATVWSDNPALVLRDFLTDAKYGPGFPAADIPDAEVIAAANVCDETVSLRRAMTVTADADADTLAQSDSGLPVALATGLPFTLETTGALPAPLAADTVYWWIAESAGVGRAAAAADDAEAGLAIDITDAGTGAHTLRKVHPFTADAAADEMTLPDWAEALPGPGLRRGMVCRVASSGTPPAPLAVDTDYYAMPLTPRLWQLATTLANARAGTAIDLSDAGTGSHRLEVRAELRYTANLAFTAEADYVSAIGAMVTAMAGRLVYAGGDWIIRAGAWIAPTVTLDEGDLAGGLRVQARHPRRDLFNALKGLYVSPDNAAIESDWPAVTNAAYEAEDNNERLWQELDLPATDSPSMAKRLAKIELERHRQQITVETRAKLGAFRLLCADTLLLDNARMGWTAKPFEIIAWGFSLIEDAAGAPALGCDLTLRETAAAVYDWNDGEETQEDPAPDTDLPDPFDVQPPSELVLTSGTAELLVGGDGTVISRIRVAWVGSTDSWVDRYELQWRNTTQLKDYGPAEVLTGDEQLESRARETFISPVVDGERYDVRLRARNNLGVASAWVEVKDHIVLGKSEPPPDLDSLRLDDELARWELASPPADLAGFRVRWHLGVNREWRTAAPLTTNLVDGYETSIAPLLGLTATVLVKAEDTSGNQSPNARHAVINQPFDLGDREIARTDLKALGFPGTIAGADVLGTGPATTLDRAGANTGTLTGGPTWIKGLTGNSALRFDGADRYVDMGDVHDFAGVAPFTLAVRFRPRIPAADGFEILAGKRDAGSANGYVLYIRQSDSTLRGLRHGGGSDTDLAGPVLVDRQVYRAALVYDGTDLRLVVDGATVAGPTASSQSIAGHAGTFRVGRDSNVATLRYRGAIDEVQVWDTDRSDAELALDQDGLLEGSELHAAIAAGLVGYWPFEEGAIEGNLEALATTRLWAEEGDALPLWDGDDFAPYWGTVYATAAYTADYVPGRSELPADLLRDFTASGRGVDYLATLDEQPFWRRAVDGAPYWQLDSAGLGLDAEPLWPAGPGALPWPGRLAKVQRRRRLLETRFLSGRIQGVISKAELVLEGHEETLKVDDFAVAATGSRVSAAAGRWRRLTELLLTLQDDGGDAVAARVADKDPTLGPRLVCLDDAGAATAGTVDVIARGIL